MSPQRMDEDRLRELFDQVSELPPGERDRFLESPPPGTLPSERKSVNCLFPMPPQTRKNSGNTPPSTTRRWPIMPPIRRSARRWDNTARRADCKGGMGAVYSCAVVRCLSFDKSVAIKLISATIHSPEVIAHFEPSAKFWQISTS